MSRFARLALVVLSVAAVASGALWWRFGAAAGHPDAPTSIECPREIDLGTVEIHRTVEGVVPITNPGGRPLAVRDITTSCGCLGVRLLSSRESLTPASVVVVPPGGRVEVAFVLRVAGAHGVRSGHTVRFQTDAPDTPAVEVRLTFTPKARYFTDPNALSFGDVAEGSRPAETINLFTTDPGDIPAVGGVMSSDPQRVRVTYTPDPVGGPTVSAEAAPDSRRFGSVRVETAELKPGESLDARVDVFAAGRAEPILAIPVSARSVRPVEFTPAVLYLPRSSSSGPVYEGAALCRANGGSLSVRPGTLPPGVAIVIENPSNDSGIVRVVVTGDPKTAGRESVVPLVAVCGGREHALSLRIVIEPVP